MKGYGLDAPVRKKEALLTGYKRVETILKGECQKGKISFEELRMGSRRGSIPRVRLQVAKRLVKELRASLAEVARLLGVSTSTISKILQRIAQEGSE